MSPFAPDSLEDGVGNQTLQKANEQTGRTESLPYVQTLSKATSNYVNSSGKQAHQRKNTVKQYQTLLEEVSGSLSSH